MALEGVVSGVGSIFQSFFPYLVWIILVICGILAYYKIKAALGYG